MKHIPGVLLFGLFSFSVLVLVGYAILESRQPQTPATTASGAVVQPINDGNGIYYFPAIGEEYRRTLSQFYADNPNLPCEYQGATENEVGTIRAITGHILHCHDEATPAQDTTVP